MSQAGIKALGLDDISPYYGGPHPLEFHLDHFKQVVCSKLREAIETAKVVEFEESIEDIEGRTLWFHSTIVPVLRGESISVEYLMVVSTDISARRRAEEERLDLERQR